MSVETVCRHPDHGRSELDPDNVAGGGRRRVLDRPAAFVPPGLALFLDQVQPDLVVLLNATLHAYRGNTVFAPPDMVVEAISPSSRRHDAERKFALYAEHGVRECWLADPERRTLRAYVLRHGAYEEIAPVDGRLPSIVIPGLSVDIARLFASLDEDL